MIKQIGILAAIYVAATLFGGSSMLSLKGKSVEAAHQGGNGKYEISGVAAASDSTVYLQDSTGSLSAYGCPKAEGYVSALIVKQGETYTCASYKKLKKIEGPYRIRDMRYGLGGWVATLDNPEQTTIRVSGENKDGDGYAIRVDGKWRTSGKNGQL